MNQLLKFYLALLISLVAGSASFALAYSSLETGPRDNSNGQISGWEVRNIHYTLGTDPSQISAVEFDLDASAGEVRVKIGEAYFACAHTGNLHWRCNLSGVSVASAAELRVIATGGR